MRRLALLLLMGGLASMPSVLMAQEGQAEGAAVSLQSSLLAPVETDVVMANAAVDADESAEVGSQTEVEPEPEVIGSVRIGGEEIDMPLTPGLRALYERRKREAQEYLVLERLLGPEREALLDHVRAEERKDEVRGEPRPWEVKAERGRANAREKAENEPLKDIEQMLRRVVHDPDIAGPVKVNVAAGYVSAVSFVDMEDTPWDVRSVVVGDGEAFNASELSPGRLAVEILKPFSASNALVELEGLEGVIVLSLVGSDSRVDVRLKVQIPRPGPALELEETVGLVNRASGPAKLLYSVLERPYGIPGAAIFDLSGKGKAAERIAGTSLAVLAEGRLLLRTRAILVSPVPVQSLGSRAGAKVHEIPEVGRLLFAEGGELVSMSLRAATEQMSVEMADGLAGKSRLPEG